MAFVFRFGLISLLFVAGALPGDDRWSRLGTLRPDSRIRIDLANGGRITGSIAAFEPARFVLAERGGNRVPVERDSVKRIARKSRARGALYGFLTGFGAGFTIGAAAGPYIADFGNPGAARRVKYGIGFGAFTGGIGAGIGALTGAKVMLYP